MVCAKAGIGRKAGHKKNVLGLKSMLDPENKKQAGFCLF